MTATQAGRPGTEGARATEPAIQVEGLVKRYGKVVAVDGLSLAVPWGSIYGLLGPDGAGKTSTLRCLTGGLSFQGGELRLGGWHLPEDLDRLRPLIGYMPQRFALYQDLTLAENLRFFADLYGVSATERAERLPHLLAFTRLAGHERKLAGQLSGGMKQKLALCTVLVHRPRILLLDEPSTGVDPVSRREFWEILLELRKEGVAILVTTPYMDEAEKCDRIGMMARGRLLVEGTPGDLRAAFPFRVLAVFAEPLFLARQILGQLPGVRTAVLHGDAVHLVVEDVAAATEEVVRALAGAGVRLGGVQEVQAGLEDVFVHELLSRGLVMPRAVTWGGERSA
ncbi:MAG TPA: ABC transporter ATP-binding protein [Firmicutes bacterium]|nr:ABC transporter ATP-binding protein [Bacillota bacterium]